MSFVYLQADVGALPLADNSADALLCDPPYGLSDSGGDGLGRINSEVVFPYLADFYSKQSSGGELPFPSNSVSLLDWVNRTIRIEAGVGMPEATLDFEGKVAGGDVKIKTTDETTCLAPDCFLTDKANPKFREQHANFILQPRPNWNAPLTDGLRRFMRENSLGCFRVSVVITLNSDFAGFLGTLNPRGPSFLANFIRFINNVERETKPPSGIVALSATELIVILGFDFRRGSIEVLPADDASDFNTLEHLATPEFIRTSAGASGLPSQFKPVQFSIVGDAANRACTFYFHRSIINYLSRNRKGFMGQGWDREVPGVEVWREVYRVLKPGAFGLVFGGTRTFPFLALALIQAGFELKDTVAWIYGSGFPKSMAIGKNINREEKNRWLDVVKAIDNLTESDILNAWIKHLSDVKSAGLSFQRSESGAGTSTLKSGSVPVDAPLLAGLIKSNAGALLAELSLCEAPLTPKGTLKPIAPKHVGKDESQSPVKCAESQLHGGQTMPVNTGIVPCDVKELQSVNKVEITRATEALMTWLGKMKSSNGADINALCAELTDTLKRIILNQFETFRGLDTSRQMECVSATTATITESTAKCLISFTVNTLRKKAIDKAAGAERAVIGYKVEPNGRCRKDEKQAYDGGRSWARSAGFRDTVEKRQITAPATEEAARWEGYGTALKPAHEIVICVRKPLTLEAVIDILVQKLGGLICQLQSFVRDVGGSSGFNPSEFAVDADSALWNAAAVCNTPEGLLALMDMWRSGSETPLSLNIVLSWLNTLAVLSDLMSRFTIEMKTGLITDLKIFDSLLSETTPAFIVRAATGQLGTGSSVWLAESIINGVRAKLECTLGYSAPVNATSDVQAKCPAEIGRGLSPDWRHIFLIRKPPEGTNAENALKWGTGALNIDGGRIGTEPSPTYPARRNAKIFRTGSGGQDVPEPQAGRWPANLVLQHTPECKRRGVKRVKAAGSDVSGCEPSEPGWAGKRVSFKVHADPNGLETVEDWDCSPECPVRMLDEQSGERPSGGGKKNPNSFVYYGNALRQSSTKGDGKEYASSTGGASRFFFCAKASPAERNAGLDGLYWRRHPLEIITYEEWEGLEPKERAEGCIHPTVKPVDLCRWLALLLLPPERETPRTLLVPFAGSGSEMIGAHLAGWDRIIGVELEPEYVEIQRRRCAWWAEYGATGVDTKTILDEGAVYDSENEKGQQTLGL